MEYNMSRKIDNVGRVLIPREILKDMGVNLEFANGESENKA